MSRGQSLTKLNDSSLYWPPGYTVQAGEDAEVIPFCPPLERGVIIDHLLAVMAG